MCVKIYYMKIGILQLGDAPFYKQLIGCTTTVSCYAELHGYDHLPQYPLLDEVGVIYQKPYGLLQHIEDYDYIVWMDLDVAIIKVEIKLESIINAHPEKQIYYCKDPLTGRKDIARPLNAGVLIFKNCQKSIDILKKWWDKCQSGALAPDGSCDQWWLTCILREMGEDEEGLDMTVMNCWAQGFKPGYFICHFMGYHLADIDAHMQYMLKNKYDTKMMGNYIEAFGKAVPNVLTRKHNNNYTEVLPEEVKRRIV